MNLPLLSIIVPIYNVEKYLHACVESLLNQTLQDIEIILVDDGSPDNCPEICNNYALKDHRIKVIHKENQGLGYARNSGLEIATGKYITFIDPDDYIDKDAYETLCYIAEKNKLDTLRFNNIRFSDTGWKSEKNYNNEFILFDKQEEIKKIALSLFDTTCVKGNIINQLGGSSCMAIYNRHIIEEFSINFLSERLYISEDLIFNFYFYLHSSKIGYLSNTYYHYRINEHSLTQTVRLDRLDKAEIFCKYVSQIILDEGFGKENLVYIMGYYLGITRSACKSVFSSNLSLREKKKWFYIQAKNKYFKEISCLYPPKRMSTKQYIFMLSMKYKLFILCYILSVGSTRMQTYRNK